MVPRELGQDILGQPVDEELLLRVAAHVGEGQHGDRRPDGAGLGGRVRRVPRQTGRRGLGLAQHHPPDPDGTGHVLQRFLAKILEPDLDPVRDLLVDRLGDADAADLRELLEPRGDVDAVTVYVAVLEDDVAEVDADPEADAPVLGHVGIAPLHALLHLDGATHGVGDGLELDQHAVAGGLDDATPVLGDGGVDQLAAMGHQPGERALLVESPSDGCSQPCRRQEPRPACVPSNTPFRAPYRAAPPVTICSCATARSIRIGVQYGTGSAKTRSKDAPARIIRAARMTPA